MKATNPFAKTQPIAEQFRLQARAAGRLPIAAGGKRAQIWAKSSDGSGELYVYDAIGGDWWGGISAKSVTEALQAMGSVAKLNVYINSEGGDVFEAKGIYTALKRFDAQKTVCVDGIAASAATLVAMAGDKIVTSTVATWMIHEAWTLAVGDAETMRAKADLLDLENNTLAEAYARKTGASVETMRALMADETWMNAATALEKGFTDEVKDLDKDADDDSVEDSARAPSSKLAAAAAATYASLEPMRKIAAAKAVFHRNTMSPGQPGAKGALRPAGKA